MGKALPTINLGKAGITQKFLQGLLDAMAANELVKVREVEGCARQVQYSGGTVTARLFLLQAASSTT